MNTAAAGDEVVVTNGVYAGGLAVTNPLTLLSVNGPQFTVINGGGQLRCAYLTDGASLSGFTLTSGVDNDGNGGGGVWCASTTAFLTNCIMTGNAAGGGAAGRRGAWRHALQLHAGWQRGYWPSSPNISLSIQRRGGFHSMLYNCTLSRNRAVNGGGASESTLYNCIVYFNNAVREPNYTFQSTLNYCCTTPDPGGIGNITNGPLLVDYSNGDLRLQSNSPCINAGNNAYVTSATDLRRQPAHRERHGGHRGLRIPGRRLGDFLRLAPAIRPAHGRLGGLRRPGPRWHEQLAGVGLRHLIPPTRSRRCACFRRHHTGTNATVTWQSVAGVNYFLERSANLASPFTLLATNIIGQAGTTSYADTNATGAGPFFYRVGVKSP